MRAIAALSVLVSHAAVLGGAIGDDLGDRLLAHLNIGVTIFFLISGFLLYRPFIAKRGGGPEAPRTVDYARRRVLRIYPAYWVVLTVLVLAPGLVGVFHGDWLTQYTLLQTVVRPADGGCTSAILDCGLAQTWSLGIEVTFYAVLALYVLASAALARGRSVREWMRVELLLLAALSATSVALLASVDETRWWLDGTFVGWFLWFALGMGLAVISVGLEHRPDRPAAVRLIGSRPLLPWLAAAAGYVVLSLSVTPSPFLLTDNEQIATHVAFGLIALLLLLPAVFEDRSGGLPRRLLANPVVAWLGLISYGIFLWHYVVALELGAGGAEAGFGLVLLGTLAITIPVAALSYYFVERPLLRFKYRRRA
jgi:peptidoglycan/LPS O-acetylase OafA/YrhL